MLVVIKEGPITKFFKRLFRPFTETHLEKRDRLLKEVVGIHFGEIIDWNIQTTMYNLQLDVVHNMDEEFQRQIADVINKDKDRRFAKNISASLEDAIIDTLKHKGMLDDKNI